MSQIIKSNPHPHLHYRARAHSSIRHVAAAHHAASIPEMTIYNHAVKHNSSPSRQVSYVETYLAGTEYSFGLVQTLARNSASVYDRDS